MNGNIAALFAAHLPYRDRVLYRHYADKAWRDFTVGEVAREVGRWQAAFRREGFARGDRIALCVRNGMDWVAIDLAALGLGLVVVPLYVDDNAENVAWCVAHAEARLLDRRQLAHRRRPSAHSRGSDRCRRSSCCARMPAKRHDGGGVSAGDRREVLVHRRLAAPTRSRRSASRRAHPGARRA